MHPKPNNDIKETIDKFLEMVQKDKPKKIILIAHGGEGELSWTHVNCSKQSVIESLGLLEMAAKALRD